MTLVLLPDASWVSLHRSRQGLSPLAHFVGTYDPTYDEKIDKLLGFVQMTDYPAKERLY